MGCEQFGRQACEENNQQADRLARMLDTNDPNQSADAIRRELYDRPPALAIDLLERIQQYDQKGQGADLRIDPVIRQSQSQYGGIEYIDTGDREVVIDSELGRDRIAILRGAPQQRYDRYPYPDQGYDPSYDRGYDPGYGQRGFDPMRGFGSRGFDPLSMITEMFIGGMLNGQFSRWNHQPRRDFWRDQGGQMWYPNPSGRWGPQRSNQWGQSQSYPQYERYQSQDPNQWRGQGQQWRDQGRWQDQGQMPDWMRRMQEQRRRQQGGNMPPDYPIRRPNEPPYGTQPRPGQDPRLNPRMDPRQDPRLDPRRDPRLRIPEQSGQPPMRREVPRFHVPEQNGQPPNWRGGGRQDVPHREMPPRVVTPPARVIPPHPQPGGDRHRQR